MKGTVRHDHPLRAFFTILIEKTFYEQLGWPNGNVIRYVAALLAEFADVDCLYSVRDQPGPRRTRLSEMLLDAEAASSGIPERDAHRHIGDFTLFMMGLFPEHLSRLNTQRVIFSGDALLDYVKVGKRSYRIVSELSGEGPDEWHSPRLFRALSEQFELCVAGLGCVREDLTRRTVNPLDCFRERWLS